MLRVLLRVEAPIAGRALARIAGLPQSTVQRVLVRLRRAGLVTAEPAPPSLLYRANRDHVAMPALLALHQLDKELRSRMAQDVGAWRRPPVSVVVYGSFARGEAGAVSDLDVLVVRPDDVEPDESVWQHQVATLGENAQSWSGRRASVIDMSRREASQGMADREPYLVDAAREGWLIAGRSLDELVGHRT